MKSKKQVKMGLRCMLIILKLLQLPIMLISTLSATSAGPEIISKPGCEDRCGDIDIPYPFGMHEGCFLNEEFLITCNASFNPPKPFFRKGNISVSHIYIEGQLIVSHYIARDCYYRNGTRRFSNKPWIRVADWAVNSTANKFVAIGCDTYASVDGFYGSNKSYYATGCLSVCNHMHSVDESCTGIGCCATAIPKLAHSLNYTLSSYRNHSQVRDFNSCGYAFVVQQSSFNFSSDYLHGLNNITQLPLVLDWAIGNETCEQAPISTHYACKGNTSCYEPIPGSGTGYRCRCSQGYAGNAYLDGCQDVDECEENTHNCKKKEFCRNLQGTYECVCPKGYNGNGTKEDGCSAPPPRLLALKLSVGIVVGIMFLLLGCSWLYLGFQRRKLIKARDRFFKQNGGFILQQRLSGHEYGDTLKIFTVDELKKATNEYDESRIIGRGGHGTVFKGFLTNAGVVAIKKSQMVDQIQIEQFINEVVVLSQINHRNVVKFLGCCLETEVPLLVYEFINNGTLYDHIHDKSKASSLSWDIRLRIAAETAGVLSYLHSSASPPIIHRDVKPNNILLDENYTSEVSDFGSSRLVPVDKNHLSTVVQGTAGYLDPEYLQTSQLTEKSDVYSFGVVLVELLTGKKALCYSRPEEERYLAMYFLRSMKEDRVAWILEEHLVSQRNVQELKEVARLAVRCLQLKGDDRPTMNEVAMELEGLRATPKHPWFGTSPVSNSEEIECFVCETSDLYPCPDEDFGSPSAAYDFGVRADER